MVHAVSPADFFGVSHSGKVERGCYGCFMSKLRPSRAVVPVGEVYGCVGDDVSDKGVPCADGFCRPAGPEIVFDGLYIGYEAQFGVSRSVVGPCDLAECLIF